MQSLSHQFLAFCRSKPADEIYSTSDALRCALAQFGKPCLTRFTAEENGVPAEVYRAATYPGTNYTSTFGALADRLEAALAA